MKKKSVYFMCVFVVLGIVIGISQIASAAVGDWVIIKTALAPTFGYTNATRTDEDDEMQYGMAGEIVGTGSSTVPGANLGSMYLVNTQYNYDQGYLRQAAGEYKLVTKAEGIAWMNAQTHWVISMFADVFADTNDEKLPLITLYKGALLKVTETDGDWCKAELVEPINGKTHGYIKKILLREKKDIAISLPYWPAELTKPNAIHTLSAAEKEAIQKQIADDALSYTNSNYRWAGKTGLGLDCSGLSGMVYMLNGITTYRNSRPEPGSSIWILGLGHLGAGDTAGQRPMAGFPVALLHIDTPSNTATTINTTSTHTLASLAKAKPGDMLYWSGHQGVYLGNGEFTHANGSSASNRRNSLIPSQTEPAPTRNDLNTYGSIYTWGTAFPDEPDKIIIDRLIISRTTTANQYRIWVRMNGYYPNKAEFYPCGVNASGSPLGYDGTTVSPVIYSAFTTANLRYMLIDSPTSASAPTFTYAAAGVGNTYKPAIKLINDEGYRPTGVTKIEAIFEYPATITVN